MVDFSRSQQQPIRSPDMRQIITDFEREIDERNATTLEEDVEDYCSRLRIINKRGALQACDLN